MTEATLSVGARNPRIDLLRGVSILLVLLHHFNIAYRMDDTVLAWPLGWDAARAVFRNGNYAVTIFFVVSGFLITSNARARWGDLAGVEATKFYRQRAARILPCVLLLLLIVDLLAGAGVDIFRNHPEFGGAVPLWVVSLASLTFWMNVLMSHAGWVNYVLCVQWSLSVEEVFYLSFPILCLLLRREHRLLLVWCGLILLGPIWRATHQASEYEELNAYFSCFDGIAFGCCAAVLSARVGVPAWSAVPVQCVAAAAMAWFYLSGSIGDTAVHGVTLIACGTAVLLVAQANAPSSAPWTPLGPVRFCGRLSYELYLFHLVVLALLRTMLPPDAVAGDLKVLLLGLYLAWSVGVAVAVGKWYSEPLNRWLRQGAWSRASILIASNSRA